MQLLDIIARAHPAGNRIDLTWNNPASSQYPGIRVVRRNDTYPLTPDDGVVVAHEINLTSISDRDLRGEVVYYYTLFLFKGSPPQYDVDPHNRISTIATAPYGFPEKMYDLLPAIYHRYDATLTPVSGSNMAPEDQEKGQLRRFLDLPGYQLDKFYSMARAALNFYNLEKIDGQLLPLLAQWIGWQTDYNLEVGAQRNEIRFAPQLYQAIGLIPTVEATVKRITGWESSTKEFVHNVARTNQPERLNLWSIRRSLSGNWGESTLTSVNWAYEGRPVAVHDIDNSLLFFYHTRRRHGWDIWSKRFVAGQWQESQPVIDRASIDKHPTATLLGNNLWLFWENFDPEQSPAEQKWRIQLCNRSGSAWSSVTTLFNDDATERRLPTVVNDNLGGFWLFWLEKKQAGVGWDVKYNRYDGTDWDLAIPASATLPLDGGLDPRPEDDLLIFRHPTSTTQKLWLFWSRHETIGTDGETRWTVVYRVKQGLNPNVSDWSQIRQLEKIDPVVHDREPTVRLILGGNLEVFWSSTRDGGWSIWRSILDVNNHKWSIAQRVTTSIYSERAPRVEESGKDTLLLYRSNQSLEYTSTVYGATPTFDMRYDGTTTFDTRNIAKRALRGQLMDFQTYIYDAGLNGERKNTDHIARDTIGLYLKPTITDPDQIKSIVSRLSNVLAEFMPVTDRAVFISI